MERHNKINHFYVSAKEYAKQTGLGYRDVLFQCEKHMFECFLTEGGQWRIKVNKNEREKELEALKEENARLKSTISNISGIIAVALDTHRLD